jgi:hypothetical protein
MADIRMRNFQAIPAVIKNLLIVNGLAFFAQNVFKGSFDFTQFFALHDILSGNKRSSKQANKQTVAFLPQLLRR